MASINILSCENTHKQHDYFKTLRKSLPYILIAILHTENAFPEGKKHQFN